MKKKLLLVALVGVLLAFAMVFVSCKENCEASDCNAANEKACFYSADDPVKQAADVLDCWGLGSITCGC